SGGAIEPAHAMPPFAQAPHRCIAQGPGSARDQNSPLWHHSRAYTCSLASPHASLPALRRDTPLSATSAGRPVLTIRSPGGSDLDEPAPPEHTLTTILRARID